MERALKGDERCILDCMRLADLLLMLLSEGREALSRVGYSQNQYTPRVRRTDSTHERTHRQLIDCIRSKDSEALIEAIEMGGIDVNCMDDVGQTLLNWASAFGTFEMVEYLCEKKDASFLQSPGEWMFAGRSDQKYNAYDGTSEPRGDSEMAPIYLKFFLPLFCKTFQSTMLSSIRKSSLGKYEIDAPKTSEHNSKIQFVFIETGLIKKMIQYAQPELLVQLCSSQKENLGVLLVEVVANVLDVEVSAIQWK